MGMGVWLAFSLVFTGATPFADAERSFNSGRFEQALRQLDSALVSLPPDSAEAANAQLLRARIFHALRRETDADSALALALVADPEADFGATRVPPPLKDRLLSLKLLSRGTLKVEVVGLRNGDLLRVDGEAAQMNSSIGIGRHAVVLTDAANQVLSTASVVVRPGKVAVLKVTRPDIEPPVAAVKDPDPIKVADAGVKEVEKDPELPPPPPPPAVRISLESRGRVDLAAAASTPASFAGLLELGVGLSAGAFRAGISGFGFGAAGVGARLGVGFDVDRFQIQVLAEALGVLNRLALALGGVFHLSVRLVAGLRVGVEISAHGVVVSQVPTVRLLVPAGLSLTYTF
jgi:hypothetical protein